MYKKHTITVINLLLHEDDLIHTGVCSRHILEPIYPNKKSSPKPLY